MSDHISGLLIIGYLLLGAGTKYFDEDGSNSMATLFLSFFIASFWVFLMSLSAPSATILGAIFLSVFVSGKVDNRAFRLGAIVIFAGVVILFFLKTIIL